MAKTEIESEQILDGEIRREDLNVTTPGNAVIRKVLAGSGIAISETGADAGTGDVTISTTSTSGYTVFSIWAEDNASLDVNAFEWAFGNGSNTPLNDGVVIPIDCELFAMGLNVQGGSATVRAVIDSNSSLSDYQVAAAAPQGSVTFGTPLAITAGQLINFRTIASSGADTNQGRVSAWFRVRSTPAATSLTNDLLDVSITGINVDELIQWNGTSFVPYSINNALALKYDASNPNSYEIPLQLNLRDVNNRARANHTGTQLSNTISDLTARIKTDETTTSIAILNRTINYTDEDGSITPIVLPFQDHQSISKISDASGQIGINNSQALATYLSLTIAVPVTGQYDLDWFYIWSHDSGKDDFIGNVKLNGSIIAEHVQEPKDVSGGGIILSQVGGGTSDSATSQRYSYSGFLPSQTLTAGNHILLIEWAGSKNNDGATIYRGSLRAKRVS